MYYFGGVLEQIKIEMRTDCSRRTCCRTTGLSITPFTFKPESPIPTAKPYTRTIPSLDIHLPTPTCTRTIQPDNNGYLPPVTCKALYNHYPLLTAAIVMSFVFGLTAVAHTTQAIISKKPFCWDIIMGTLWEFGGFVSRAFGAKDQQSSALATVGQLLVVNGFDYMILARMIWFFLPSRLRLHITPSLPAIVLVNLDFASFVIQLVGGGMVRPGQSQEQVMRGVHIYMAGTPKSQWQWMVVALYLSLTFIFIRIIFRLMEFSAGKDLSNPLPYHEVYAYAFDALLMFFAISVWNIVHPGRIFKSLNSVMPSGKLRRLICCCYSGRDGQGQKKANRGTENDEDYIPLANHANTAAIRAYHTWQEHGERPSQMPAYGYKGASSNMSA
ncbi:hypothetical protein EJ08DRAFT_661789 [Tothia fuscella]|uniref:Uncharacterized protein n=1 Tax=Tothia fuscella TaxID=1048955 RepID=A0A9P4NPS2_9PEZI|nr:hypothetical protein EJ08DRAFT_661789 [Tothia fuscella]